MCGSNYASQSSIFGKLLSFIPIKICFSYIKYFQSFFVPENREKDELNWQKQSTPTFQEFVFTKGTILKLTAAQNALQTNPFSRYCFRIQFSIQRRGYWQNSNGNFWWTLQCLKTLNFGWFQVNLWFRNCLRAPFEKWLSLKATERRESLGRRLNVGIRGSEKTSLEWKRNTRLPPLMSNLPQKGHQRKDSKVKFWFIYTLSSSVWSFDASSVLDIRELEHFSIELFCCTVYDSLEGIATFIDQPLYFASL